MDGKKKKAYHVKPITKKAPGALSAEILVVTNNYDKGLQEQASLYAKYPLKGAELRSVGSWEELVKLLEEYKSIKRLVIYIHGIPGALLLGGHGEDLDTVGDKYFKDKKMPKVEQLDLEACSVAEKPEKTLPFAKLFDAGNVAAWNYFHVGQAVKIKVPSGARRRDVEDRLKHWKGYMLENTPSADEMIHKPNDYKLGAEWFRNDLSEDPLPPPSDDVLDPRSHTFKRRSSATEVTLRSVKELGGYTEKYKDDPVRPLEHVTIDLPAILKELSAMMKDMEEVPFFPFIDSLKDG